MIGSDLEGADLESRVASWAASVISNDATAVRAVIKVYGDRLAATDVAGVVSRYRGNATSASPAAVRCGTHGATGRSRSACASRCRSSQEGAAPASSESATRIPASACGSPGTTRLRLRRYLPARTGAVQVDVGVAGAVRVPALGALALLGLRLPPTDALRAT
jgi:hypothetical protein